MNDYRFDGEPLDPAGRAQVISQLDSEGTKFESIKMLSRCVFNYDDDRYEFRYAFVADKKGLRIEQFPLTGFYSLSALASDGTETTVVFQNEKRALRLPAGGAGLERLFGTALPLEEGDIGLLLAGLLPKRFYQGELSMRRGTDGVALIRSESLYALLGADSRLSELHLFEPGSGKEEVNFRVERDGDAIPGAFTLGIPAHEVTLECKATQRSRDQQLKPDVFTLAIPAGFSVD